MFLVKIVIIGLIVGYVLFLNNFLKVIQEKNLTKLNKDKKIFKLIIIITNICAFVLGLLISFKPLSSKTIREICRKNSASWWI